MSAYNNLFECIECPIFRIKIDEYVGGIAVRPKPQHCGQLISIIRGFGGSRGTRNRDTFNFAAYAAFSDSRLPTSLTPLYFLHFIFSLLALVFQLLPRPSYSSTFSYPSAWSEAYR